VIPVRVRIDRKGVNTGLVVREKLPSGWVVVASSPVSGSMGGDGAKWFLPEGTGEALLSYTVRAPEKGPTSAAFEGKVLSRVDDRPAASTTSGNGSLAVDGRHWADGNGDGRIDDAEIFPAYHLTEEMKELGLDWKTIEAIWVGKGYRWDPRRKTFEVVR
jgi:hypothetical protein